MSTEVETNNFMTKLWSEGKNTNIIPDRSVTTNNNYNHCRKGYNNNTK